MSKKKIFLLRHATSDNKHSGGDESRPLSNLGTNEAYALGQHMQKNHFAPEFVLCSAAKRTSNTLNEMQKNVEIARVKHLKILYTGNTGDYFTQIQKCENTYKDIMIIGHNPAIYSLASMLSDKNNGNMQTKLIEGFRPATLCIMECPLDDWEKIQPDSCQITHISSPIDYYSPARPTRWM